ncbi:hypothetical protein HHI36_004586 [Cryptolaemus montrouzieri]|uniref:Uncharacterized protein n=1 Tax=Cryptolaemus montrouzieri TaxID=559131 RepID=A0ABD2NRM0_9CUCU
MCRTDQPLKNNSNDSYVYATQEYVDKRFDIVQQEFLKIADLIRDLGPTKHGNDGRRDDVAAYSTKKWWFIHDFKELVLIVGFHIIGVSETWLKPEFPDSALHIPGLRLYRKHRPTRGGGVAIHVADHISTRILDPVTVRENINTAD